MINLAWGCNESPAPYSYENGGSCDKCRSMTAEEIASIIRMDSRTMDATFNDTISRQEAISKKMPAVISDQGTDVVLLSELKNCHLQSRDEFQ